MDAHPLQPQLARIEQLLIVIAKLLSAPVIADELRDPKLAKLYELTGSVTADEAAKKLACSKTTVSEAWRRWERAGLVILNGRRYERVF